MGKRLFVLAAGLTLAAAASAGLAAAIPEELLANAAAGEVSFFLVLKEQADLSAARFQQGKAARGVYVFERLTETAEISQAPLRTWLDERGITYRPYWIQNMILVTAGQDVLLELAARPEVGLVRPNQVHQVLDPAERANAYAAPAGRTIEWNIAQIRADDVWTELGITGEGIVVCDNDTGVQWDHPALRNKYRGWNGTSADHNYNWHDATGAYPNAPGDNMGHGTHTTGTMVGDDGGANQIGVAPGAQWIAFKNMDSGGSGSDEWFHDSFEWILAPTNLAGTNPDPTKAPHVVNNSWGYWGGGDDQFEPDLDALSAAGIFVEVSAGNEGSSCSSLRSPGDYDNVFTTGATVQDASPPPTIWGSSSRGPSSLYPGITKPDISAPGENIRSSIPGSSYEGGWNGTSMAGPHACGLVALLWSADDNLIGDIAATRTAIEQTAVPRADTACGAGGPPNNVYGWGEIDCLAAVEPHAGPQSTGVVEFDRGAYRCEDTATIAVEDSDLAGQGSLAIQVVSSTEPAGIQVTLTEGEPGAFAGELSTAGGPPVQDSLLQVADGDTITATYVDQNYGGAGQQTLVATAAADCVGPVVSGVAVESRTGAEATIVWTTDEPASSLVRYGASVPPAQTADDDALATAHSLELTGLAECTFYYFEVESTDEAGNVTIDNQAGAYYSFMTLERVIMLEADMSTNPGWTVEGQWAWGSPTGGGGEYGSPDPAAGYTGANVYGYNLSGDYPDDMAQTLYLTTPDFDCSAASAVELSFRCWLGVEQSVYDHANLQISVNGGSSWSNVWQNSATLDGGTWELLAYSLPTAVGQADVRLRWGMGPTDGGWRYCGWNIDDVLVMYETECENPTPTPFPTFTPVPTETPVPTATPVSTVTPEPSATPALELGVRLDMPAIAHPGEPFHIDGFLDNPGAALDNVPTFFILEVYGEFWFWPGWKHFVLPDEGEIDYTEEDVPPGSKKIQVLAPFDWPDTGSQTVTGLHFYGAMLNGAMDDILGEMAVVEWGYGPR